MGSLETLKKELESVEKKRMKRENLKIKQIPRAGLADLNIDPSMLPLASMDIPYFYSEMQNKFHTEFDDEDFVGIGQMNTDPISSMKLLIRNGKALKFRGGTLKLESIGQSSEITQIMISEQHVVAAVSGGSTDEALLLCKSICILIWNSCNIQKRWEDVAPYLAMERYKSTTVVHMPFSLRNLLSKQVNVFLDDDVCGDNGYGKDMGLRNSSVQLRSSRNNEITVLAYCHQINLIVTTFNTVSGRSEDNEISLMLENRDHANRGRIFFISELPISEHVKVVESIIDRVQENL